MQRSIFFPIVLAALILLLPVSSLCADDRSKPKAILAAEVFLLMVDTSQYGKSWDITSSFFKSQVSKEVWVQQISNLRPQLGSLVKRKIKSAKYMTQLPGAPDGEYYVIEYETSYARKQNAIETITSMLDTDGQWGVSGYYIK